MKQKKHKATTNRKGLPQSRVKQPKPLIKYFWKSVVASSVILGIFVSFLTLSPNLLVIPSQSIDLENPLLTPFLIMNDGLLPIHSVIIFWGINVMRNSSGNVLQNFSLGYSRPPIAILNRKEQKTFFCPPVFNWQTPINFGDIVIRVLYRPDFLFWRQESQFRFVTITDKTGTTRWYPKPLSEK